MSKFLGTVRKMELNDRFPCLLSLTPKARYGVPLRLFPEQLRKETEALLHWKQAVFSSGRPNKARHSKDTGRILEMAFVQLFGYLTNIAGRDDVKTIQELVTEEIVTTYVEWGIDVRELNPKGLRSRLKLLKAALRQCPKYKGCDWNCFTILLQSIRDDSKAKATARKLKRMLPYSVASSIPNKIGDLRLKLTGPALARNVRDELIMKWLIVLAWRQRNIRECRIGGTKPNLFKGPIPKTSGVAKPRWVEEVEKQDPAAQFWQARFSGGSSLPSVYFTVTSNGKAAACCELQPLEHRDSR